MLTIDMINQISEALDFNFMTVADYKKGIEKGEIPLFPSEDLMDDIDLARQYPSHPLAHPNRRIRIEAADRLRNMHCELPSEVLDIIHKHLFDCSPAVRQSLAGGLIFTGNRSSLPFLRDLLEEETESYFVKCAASMALKRIHNNWLSFKKDFKIYIGDGIEQVLNGQGIVCYELGFIIYEGGFRNNLYHGRGRLLDSSGEVIYKGDFINGERLRTRC